MKQATELMIEPVEESDNSAEQIELDMAAQGYEAAYVESLDTGDNLPF